MLKQSWALFKTSVKHGSHVKRNTTITIILELVSIGLLYLLNKQYGTLYEGIQTYNTALIWSSIIKFSGIAGILVIVGGLITYYMNKMAFSIRRGLTHYFTKLYESGKLHSATNIEQRIQEDLRLFGEKSCEFWFAVLRSSLKVPIFLGVIVTLTQWYVSIIILVAIIVGTYLTKLVAKKVIELQAIQETNEADFRKRLRNPKNAFNIWFVFFEIEGMFHKINKQIKKIAFLQSGLSQMFVLLPFIVLLPLYISKQVTLGAFMQSVNALSKVIDSLTVLIDNRQLIVSISVCLKRLEDLKEVKT